MKPFPTDPSATADFTQALRIASRLTTDAMGRTVPDAKLRAELRDMQPNPAADWGGARREQCGTKPALDASQRARVRELRTQGIALLDIARMLKTSYYRVQQVD